MQLELGFYARTILGIRQLMRTPPLAAPEQVICNQLKAREETFLEITRKLVFSNPASPYFKMFELAGCTWADLENSVHRYGLEATLDRLMDAGVYLTHEEFKGKRAIIRAGCHIPASTASFQNPFGRGRFESFSGGSSSKAVRSERSLEFRLYGEAWRRFQQQEWGVEKHLPVTMFPILPSTIFLSSGLSQSRMGRPYAAWFTVDGGRAHQRAYRLGTAALVSAARLFGAHLPYPTFLPPGGPERAAVWIAERKREGKACAVWCFAASAVQVARVALEGGWDIAGTVFLAGSEPLSPAKRSVIERAGAYAYGQYHISEIGLVGTACRAMTKDNDFHLSLDMVAATTRKREIASAGAQINVLFFTTLHPNAPHFFINADMGDAGELEPAGCDCTFARAGFKACIRKVYSYSKLNSQGVTLAAADLARILEEVLPARLGGVTGDYQLVEQEVGGEPHLTLRVSPRAGLSDAGLVRECFLREIQTCYGGSMAFRLWRHADAISVCFAEPLISPAGKVLPLHLLKAESHAGHES